MEITPRPVRSTAFRHDAPTGEQEPMLSARVLVQIPDLNTEAETVHQYRPVFRKVYISPKQAMAAIAVAVLIGALVWMRGGEQVEATADKAPDWQVTAPGASQWAGTPSAMTPAEAMGSIAGPREESPSTNLTSAPPLMASSTAIQPEIQPQAVPLHEADAGQYPPHHASQHGPSFTYPSPAPHSSGLQDSAAPVYQQQSVPFGQTDAGIGGYTAQPNLSSSVPSYPSTPYGEASLQGTPDPTRVAGSQFQQPPLGQQPAGQQQFNSWANQQPMTAPAQPTWANQPVQQQTPFGQADHRIASRPDLQPPVNNFRAGQPGVAQPTGQIFHPTAEPRHEQHGSGLY